MNYQGAENYYRRDALHIHFKIEDITISTTLYVPWNSGHRSKYGIREYFRTLPTFNDTADIFPGVTYKTTRHQNFQIFMTPGDMRLSRFHRWLTAPAALVGGTNHYHLSDIFFILSRNHIDNNFPWRVVVMFSYHVSLWMIIADELTR